MPGEPLVALLGPDEDGRATARMPWLILVGPDLEWHPRSAQYDTRRLDRVLPAGGPAAPPVTGRARRCQRARSRRAAADLAAPLLLRPVRAPLARGRLAGSALTAGRPAAGGRPGRTRTATTSVKPRPRFRARVRNMPGSSVVRISGSSSFSGFARRTATRRASSAGSCSLSKSAAEVNGWVITSTKPR